MHSFLQVPYSTRVLSQQPFRIYKPFNHSAKILTPETQKYNMQQKKHFVLHMQMSVNTPNALFFSGSQCFLPREITQEIG